jgi:pantoate--beta-alanine ligase
MVILRSLSDLAQWQDSMGWHQGVGGFVPTMGALHEGHEGLIRQAVQSSDVVVVSILVNPTQFNDSRDFDGYPRTLESDVRAATLAGAHAVFAPTPEELYGGTPHAPHVHWGPLTHGYEGAHRPGHFDGVIAVVDLLFSVVRPRVAVFGEKDLQQVAVVKRLAKERHPEVRIDVGRLVRDANGLALSSRNARLGEHGIREALSLSQALFQLRDAILPGMDSGGWDACLERARHVLANSPGLTMEYVDIVDATTFKPARSAGIHPVHAIVAGHVRGVRLIDNVSLMA